MGARDDAAAHTQAKVREAARSLFRRHGWSGVNLRMVAKAAGRSTSSIFSHWPSKEALWRDAMGYDWPDPRAFAGLVRKMASPRLNDAGHLAQINVAARAFMLAWAGENHGWPVWKAPEEDPG
jgi:AcrR family transcriptional regulator